MFDCIGFGLVCVCVAEVGLVCVCGRGWPGVRVRVCVCGRGWPGVCVCVCVCG